METGDLGKVGPQALTYPEAPPRSHKRPPQPSPERPFDGERSPCAPGASGKSPPITALNNPSNAC
jgi:hypothetical protein